MNKLYHALSTTQAKILVSKSCWYANLMIVLVQNNLVSKNVNKSQAHSVTPLNFIKSYYVLDVASF